MTIATYSKNYGQSRKCGFTCTFWSALSESCHTIQKQLATRHTHTHKNRQRHSPAASHAPTRSPSCTRHLRLALAHGTTVEARIKTRTLTSDKMRGRGGSSVSYRRTAFTNSLEQICVQPEKWWHLPPCSRLASVSSPYSMVLPCNAGIPKDSTKATATNSDSDFILAHNDFFSDFDN